MFSACRITRDSSSFSLIPDFEISTSGGQKIPAGYNSAHGGGSRRVGNASAINCAIRFPGFTESSRRVL